MARVHFVGTTQIGASPGTAFLRELGDLPVSSQLREQTLEKLASAPYALLQQRTAPGSGNYAKLFRPLLEDLLRSESYLEIRAGTGAFPELSLSVRLQEHQARLWSSNLAVAATGWTIVQTRPVQVEGYSGWELKKHHPPNLMRVLRAGDWCVIGVGQDRLELEAATLDRIKRSQRPVAPAKDYWLSALINGPQWAPWLADGRTSNLPVVRLTWNGAGENTQFHGSLAFPAGLNWEPEPWQVPTNLVRGDLMSFTAAQGFGSWLRQRKAWQRYNWLPLPERLLTWTEAANPLETYVTVPMGNATNELAEFAPRLASALNTNFYRASVGAIRWRPRELEVAWEGVPFIAPFLRAVPDAKGGYWLAGLTRPPRSTGVQPESIRSAGLTNQVYFDWENTGANLARWRNLSLLLLPLSGKGLMSTEAVAGQWLEAIRPKLGEASTQIVLTAPAEFELWREGKPGLTGIELVALANWLEATNFPWLGYQIRGRGEPGR